MNLDSIILSVILIAGFYLLFYLGKKVYSLVHRDYDLEKELVHKDNPAVALAITGYYTGLVLSIGGAIVGPSNGFASDIIDLLLYGSLSIVLLNISCVLCDKIILYRFRMTDELVRDRNQGTGAVSMGVSVASGFLIYGAVSGEGGTLWTAVSFWAIGQVILIIAGLVYNRILSFDIHEEIEKDNVAAGVGFAGALIAVGIVVGLAAEGDFTSWSEDLPHFMGISIVGLVLLPIIRFLTDKVLLPSVNLSDEIIGLKPDKSIETRGPNVGAAYIEAFSYIAGAFIICWCV